MILALRFSAVGIFSSHSRQAGAHVRGFDHGNHFVILDIWSQNGTRLRTVTISPRAACSREVKTLAEEHHVTKQRDAHRRRSQ